MSFDWYRRANECIAQGSLTNSKRLECFVKGVYPSHAIKGQGAKLKCVDGKWYLDFLGALGTNLFGYANPHINQAVIAQLSDGTLFSLGSTLEVDCGELVQGTVPFVKKVRFLKDGSGACTAALRISRAHTGRKRVLSSGYHGWHDGFASLALPAIGVPEDPNIESLVDFSQIKSDIAAVIVEPILTDYSERRLQWLTELVRKCRVNGTLVIFDEVITGFRWPGVTFSRDSGIHPDIICLGKAMGGGLPLSCVGLAEHIGDGKEWFVSSTFAGDTTALAAFKKTHEILRNVYKIQDLWREGGYFLEEFNAIWPERIKLEGYPTRSIFVGDELTRALFCQEACKAGILLHPVSFFFGFQHIEYRQSTISTFKDILLRIRNNQVKLEGEMPASPFSQKVRAA